MPRETVVNAPWAMTNPSPARLACRQRRKCGFPADHTAGRAESCVPYAAAPPVWSLPSGVRHVAAVIVAGVGTAVSLFLAWSAITGDTIAGCGEGTLFSCSHVLHSKFSKVWGIPVSIPGALTFVAILGSLCIRYRDWPAWQRLRCLILPVAVGTAAGSALWFTGLQVFQLGKFCVFCLVVHTCSLTLAVLVLGRGAPLGWWVRRLLPACGAVTLMAVVQWTSADPRTFVVTDQEGAGAYEVLELDF